MSRKPSRGGLTLSMQRMGRSVRQAMACRTERPILCIDRVKPPRDGFLDIGPRAGAAYPLVVKTLVFGKEQQL